MKNNLKNKKILICQPIICGIGGSTVVTLELAEFLQSQGAIVQVYTCASDNPAQKFYKDRHVSIVTADESPNLHISDFDYIWVNSQIIPKSFLEDLQKEQKAKFIFCHMSGIDWIPDERPWIYELEEKICSLKLFISEETRDFNDDFIDKKLPYRFFRNPSPDVFGELPAREPKTSPRKILIVSNHPPREMVEAKIELESKGIEVYSLGEIGGKIDLISPKHIKEADLVITIAKTTQYCLVSGTPVYIYDHFGGPGYLSSQNFNHCQHHNFSGRYTQKKDGHQIATEILANYQRALKYHQENRWLFKKEYLNSNVIPDIFKTVKLRTISPLRPKHINAISLDQDLAINYFRALKREGNLKAEKQLLEDKIKHLQLKNQKQSLKLQKIEQDYNNIVNTEAWKLGKAIMLPISKIKNFINKASR